MVPSSSALVQFTRKRPLPPTFDYYGDARSSPKRMQKSTSTIDWNSATVTLRVGPEKAPFRVDAGILREKSKRHFTNFFPDDWNESVEIPLPSMEPREFKIVKDWLYGWEPRWIEHYMNGRRGGPPEEVGFNARDQWPSSSRIRVDSWKCHYCHHLCQLWIHGSCFGEDFQEEVIKRSRKITLDDRAGVQRAITMDEPDWTTAFVLAPATLGLIYDNTADKEEEYSPLRTWAADTVASRLDMPHLHIFSRNDLPKGYLSAVYQRKYSDNSLAHYKRFEELMNLRRELKYQVEVHEQTRKEVKRQGETHEEMHKWFKDQGEDWFRSCWAAECTPSRHRSCKLRDYLDSRPM